MAPIIFYDLTKKDPVRAWVHNALKTRLVLNYLGLDYKTKFLEFPDVEPLLKSFGVPPNQYGQQYAVPAVAIPHSDSQPEPYHYVQGEAEVPKYLQSLKPSMDLRFDAPQHEEVNQAMGEIMGPLRSVWMPALFDLLNPVSQARFSNRKLNLSRDQGTEEQAWGTARVGLDKLSAMLKESGGPYIMGKQVSFADFVVVASLQFFRVADMSIYDRTVKEMPALGTLYEACEQWTEKDT